MGDADRKLLNLPEEDAAQAYAVPDKAVGLSARATHERVHKLLKSGVIRRTTVDVNTAAVGSGVLAFVMVDSSAWRGGSGGSFAAIPELQEAYIIAGSASSVLVKTMTGTTEQLQDVLQTLFEIERQWYGRDGGPENVPQEAGVET